MITNQSTLNAMFIGFKADYQSAFAGAPRDYEKIVTVIPSATRENAYPWLGQTFKISEWLGDRVIQNLDASDYTLKNKKYEGTVAIKRDDIEDDSLGIYKPVVQGIGRAAGDHPNELVFSLLKNGFTSPCYDGQYFFDPDHPVGLSGREKSVSNFMGGTGTAWYLMCTSRPLKPLIWQVRRDYEFTNMDAPTDEAVFMREEYRYGVSARCNAGYGFWQMCVASRQPLTPENYAGARAAMLSYVSDVGTPLGLLPDLLVVPPNLEGAARKILINDRSDSGASNEWAGSAETLMTPWLTEA
ncbi:hypothetical protein C4J81_15390 [Deltaproteobacteria bacterium Smac51]|nr:hypothetical protein C4J81_10125 [Deltaproteobacteria bacterium Smac51]UQZ90514.1 hypothetical protein C4J81_15390 [Deltaproteobacteria bacterium Smac51]